MPAVVVVTAPAGVSEPPPTGDAEAQRESRCDRSARSSQDRRRARPRADHPGPAPGRGARVRRRGPARDRSADRPRALTRPDCLSSPPPSRPSSSRAPPAHACGRTGPSPAPSVRVWSTVIGARIPRSSRSRAPLSSSRCRGCRGVPADLGDLRVRGAAQGRSRAGAAGDDGLRSRRKPVGSLACRLAGGLSAPGSSPRRRRRPPSSAAWCPPSARRSFSNPPQVARA